MRQHGLGKWEQVAKALGTGRTPHDVSTTYYRLTTVSNGGNAPDARNEQTRGAEVAKGAGRPVPASELVQTAERNMHTLQLQKVGWESLHGTWSPRAQMSWGSSEGPPSPRAKAPVAPKPAGWFQTVELGKRDGRIKWQCKQPVLPPKQCRPTTVTIPFRLLSNQSRSRQATRQAAASIQADADETPRPCSMSRNKVPVHLKRVVNWAATEHTLTSTTLFFSPLDSNMSQSARSHTAGGVEGQMRVPRPPDTARAVMTDGRALMDRGGHMRGGRGCAVERRRPNPLQLPSEIGYTRPLQAFPPQR